MKNYIESIFELIINGRIRLYQLLRTDLVKIFVLPNFAEIISFQIINEDQ